MAKTVGRMAGTIAAGVLAVAAGLGSSALYNDTLSNAGARQIKNQQQAEEAYHKTSANKPKFPWNQFIGLFYRLNSLEDFPPDDKEPLDVLHHVSMEDREIIDRINRLIIKNQPMIDQEAEALMKRADWMCGSEKTAERNGLVDVISRNAHEVEMNLSAIYDSREERMKPEEASFNLRNTLSKLENNFMGSVLAKRLVDMRIWEICLGEKGVVDGYRDYARSMVYGNCETAETIARGSGELDPVMRAVMLCTPLEFRDEKYEADIMLEERLERLARLSDDELAASANYFNGDNFRGWHQRCGEIRTGRGLSEDEALAACLADYQSERLSSEGPFSLPNGVSVDEVDRAIANLPGEDIKRWCVLIASRDLALYDYSGQTGSRRGDNEESASREREHFDRILTEYNECVEK